MKSEFLIGCSPPGMDPKKDDEEDEDKKKKNSDKEGFELRRI